MLPRRGVSVNGRRETLDGGPSATKIVTYTLTTRAEGPARPPLERADRSRIQEEDPS
jgi:hypothetical protein